MLLLRARQITYVLCVVEFAMGVRHCCENVCESVLFKCLNPCNIAAKLSRCPVLSVHELLAADRVDSDFRVDILRHGCRRLQLLLPLVMRIELVVVLGAYFGHV